MSLIYLDNSATTRPLSGVIDAVSRAMAEEYGNPSSLHRLGMQAETAIEQARTDVARLLGADRDELYFTSGATESNNVIIRGIVETRRHRGNHVIITSVEHPSVKRLCEELEKKGTEVTYLPVDEWGHIDPRDVDRSLRSDTVLCSVMAVNNEVGSVQPLAEVGQILARSASPRPVFHTDAVQAVGKLDLRWSDLGIDSLSLSAHKFHGPRGVGALYVRIGLDLPPLITGGGQERGLRSGTENTPGILGMAEAARWLRNEGSAAYARLRHLRRYLGEQILKTIPDSHVNGPPPDASEEKAAPHILNISFPGIRGETLVHALEERGIFVSTGSACSSRRADERTAVDAMPIGDERAQSAIRISLCPFNTRQEINSLLSVLEQTVPALRRISSRMGRGGR
ncbi:MAG: cysteine desulfurase family protein [Bacillota bacterium]